MSGGCLVPTMRYADSKAAVEWLQKAFGFKLHFSVPTEDGAGITHAELTYGNGMVMLGQARNDEMGKVLQPPKGSPVETAVTYGMCAYIVVADADAHYARAVAAGAKIFQDLKDNEGYPGRGYACRDCEGYIWFINTYDSSSWIQRGSD